MAKKRKSKSTEEKLRVIKEKEEEQKREIVLLESEIEQIKGKQQKSSYWKWIEWIGKALLLSTPLLALLFFSFEGDIELYLSPFGILLLLILYFGTLAYYLARAK